jgi:hypothetical protein
MGEAKRRQACGMVVYHHTSTLRTNLIWMSGVIEIEGKGRDAFHPHLGVIKSDTVGLRRACRDFPPLAWFTVNRNVPGCLLNTMLAFIDPATGEPTAPNTLEQKFSNTIALNRLALGFKAADIPVTRSRDHPGYATGEGQALNETARRYGDDPDEWFVSEVPVDVMKISEVLVSGSIMTPRLKRADWYLKDIRRMVALCKSTRAYIPPSWMKSEEAKAFVAPLGIPTDPECLRRLREIEEAKR